MREERERNRALAHYIAIMPEQINDYNKITGVGHRKTAAFPHLHLLKGRCNYLLFVDCGLICDKNPNAVNLRLAGQDGNITTENCIPRDCIVQVIAVGLDHHRDVKVVDVLHGALKDRLSNREKREKANYDHLCTDIAETYGHNNKKFLSTLSSFHSHSSSSRPAKRPPTDAPKAMGSSSDEETPRKKPERTERTKFPVIPHKSKPQEKPTSPANKPDEPMEEVEMPVEKAMARGLPRWLRFR